MFILKSLVAVLALGLVQDTIAAAAAPACCTNKCGKSVQLAKNGKKDCSALLIKTVTPTRTTTHFRTTTITRKTTLSRTITLTGGSTVTKAVTDTTDITVTTIASETDYSTSTSLATVEETETVTDISTAVETNTETTTVPYVSNSFIKRNAKPTKPAYASACDNSAYTRACSCIGIKPKTTTRAAVVKTVYKTRTAYKTNTAYTTFTVYKTNTETRTSTAPAETRTEIVSLTTYTTIISGTAITATETLTLTESATTTETTVVVTTQTAAPVPPTCVGKGFSFHLTGSVVNANGWGMGMINSIGQGIYVRLFSGGSSAMVIDGDNGLQSWYGSDYQYVILTGSLPTKVWIKSARSNVSYTWQQTALTCGIGSGPNYDLTCKSATTTYLVTFCRNPTYFEWELYVYTDVSQLAGMVCSNDGAIKATCIP
ncbi:hypothetical protein AOL_s00109g39 [Orbilia oligospora ATCC 24927]|uniref:CBM-cenC domain-containing protein n=1 Tax=Arthrobotrys oligospora (strain ATCC 24927 / CBS 115.81 / DSM 1491) TaxID=756982 RepID=G1XK10_ARTOA|nr:hypothetical protein AOL_s00109g39 [Orbilia oligospora ATCC 24927]EGX46467.1 hypothetical protein AOL_s00109g39 [Orbilia oligospora ATCC 24927]